MSVAKKILSEPYKRVSKTHWFSRLDEKQQVECLLVWEAFQRGKTDIPAVQLAERIKKEYPLIDRTVKQISVWLRDKEGDQRASESARKKAKA